MNNTVTEFQIMEYYDPEKDKIWKVELQYRQVIKTSAGNISYADSWERVPRQRYDLREGSI